MSICERSHAIIQQSIKLRPLPPLTGHSRIKRLSLEVQVTPNLSYTESELLLYMETEILHDMGGSYSH